MDFAEEPSSSFWFSLFIIVPVVLFILAICMIRKAAEEDGLGDNAKADRLKVY